MVQRDYIMGNIFHNRGRQSEQGGIFGIIGEGLRN